MDFAVTRDGRRLLTAPEPATPDGELPPAQEGEVVVSLSPVTLLPGVLGRLARTLAATAHFSLDRFSDVYLVTDTGSSVRGRRIDLYIRDCHEAVRFGRRSARVSILH